MQRQLAEVLEDKAAREEEMKRALSELQDHFAQKEAGAIEKRHAKAMQRDGYGSRVLLTAWVSRILLIKTRSTKKGTNCF